MSERPPASSAAVSQRMRKTGRRDTSPELAIRRALHARGHRYFVDRRPSPRLRTRADLVFPRLLVAVFIDGCFWHGCPEHGTSPKSNATWWREKIGANIQRDRRTDRQLTEEGWRVVRVWEHESVEVGVGIIEDVLERARATE